MSLKNDYENMIEKRFAIMTDSAILKNYNIKIWDCYLSDDKKNKVKVVTFTNILKMYNTTYNVFQYNGEVYYTLGYNHDNRELAYALTKVDTNSWLKDIRKVREGLSWDKFIEWLEKCCTVGNKTVASHRYYEDATDLKIYTLDKNGKEHLNWKHYAHNAVCEKWDELEKAETEKAKAIEKAKKAIEIGKAKSKESEKAIA